MAHYGFSTITKWLQKWDGKFIGWETGFFYNQAEGLYQRITRKKHVDSSDTKTELIRCLSLGRLIFIGLGKTVGVGIYVLIGVATKEYAGPSIVLSFLVAFLVTLLNGLCFAEYASRNPRTGAQYTYMYETLGEGMAFIVGWISILNFTSSGSIASRGWSGYVDSMFNHAIQNFTINHIANWTHRSPLPEYPDFPAIFIIIFVMVTLSVGVNFSTLVNSIFTGVSVGILIFITLFGLYYADFKNWFNDNGGFFPFGFRGVLKASSACFYAFQGFEILGLSSEEAVNPEKTIPLAIVLTLVIVTVLYLGVSISFTLMIPYLAVNTNAPFPSAFQYHSVTWAKYLVAIGPIFALANLCSLELFTLQRLAYSMSSDGLLFSFLSKINKIFKVPLGPIVVFGPVVIALILCIDLSNLIGFMLIYGFLQYSLFSSYLIVLRYEASSDLSVMDKNPSSNKGEHSIELSVKNTDEGYVTLSNQPDIVNSTAIPDNKPCEFNDDPMSPDIGSLLKEQDVIVENIDEENRQTDLNDNGYLLGNNDTKSLSGKLEKTVVNIHKRNSLQLALYNTLTSCSALEKMKISRLVIVLYVVCFLLAFQLIHGGEDVLSGQWLSLLVTVTLTVIIALAVLCIWCQEQKGSCNGFLIPMMPFSPVLCLLFNMMMLVSIAEKGSILASFTLASVGVVLYVIMVMCDIYKDRRIGVGEHVEYASLLAKEEEMDGAEEEEI